MTWRHLTFAGCAASVVHHYLASRVMQLDINPPGLLELMVSPPLNAPFFWYPLVASALIGIAVWKSSLRLVAVILVGVFIAGYLRLMWDIGTGPGEKVDPRFIYAALTAHAMGWASFACAVGALLIGAREFGKTIGDTSFRP